MTHISLDRHLTIIEEALHVVASFRDAIEATCCELEIQLEEFRLKVYIEKKIEAKVTTIHEGAEEDVN